METFTATAYSDTTSDPRWRLANLPAVFALRFDLDHPDGAKTVLIYEQMPAEQELMSLAWKLQTAAGRGEFTVTRIEPDGSRIDLPALRGRSS